MGRGAQGQVNDLVKYPFVAYLAVCLCKPNGKKQHEAPGNLCGYGPEVYSLDMQQKAGCCVLKTFDLHVKFLCKWMFSTPPWPLKVCPLASALNLGRSSHTMTQSQIKLVLKITEMEST